MSGHDAGRANAHTSEQFYGNSWQCDDNWTFRVGPRHKAGALLLALSPQGGELGERQH
jgi:hypothetical protein